MDLSQYEKFLTVWYQVALTLGLTSLGLGLLNYLFFKINLSFKRTYKEKFDLVSQKQKKRLLQSHIYIAGALFFLINDVFGQSVKLTPIWFIVRMFVSFCIASLYGYVAHLVLQFHYPLRLEKILKKLRYTPRINPKTGNRMILLNEEEEDAYLDEGMQAEENTFTVDYDVWKDEETGYTHIEKYEGHLSTLECDRCGFHTLKLNNEEIIREPTETDDGEILKEYTCSYCNRIKRKNVALIKTMKNKSEMVDPESGSAAPSGSS